MSRPLLAVPTMVAALSAASAQAPWTQDQLAADLDQIAAAVREQWSHLDDHREHFGVDLDALLARAKAALPTVQSADDFARVVRRFAAALQDGHAWSFVPGETQPERRLPFRVVSCAEGLVVSTAADGLERPRRGDLLLAVGGTDVAACLVEAEAEVFASTPGMRRQLAIQRILRTGDPRRRCAFQGEDGGRWEVELTTLASDAELPEPQPWQANWTLDWPQPDVALLTLSSFTVPRWQEWLVAKHEDREPFLAEGRARVEAIITELDAKQATALVVDLRGNTGGTDSLGIHLAERLLDEPFVYFLLSAQADGRWRPPGGITYGKGDHERFGGKVVLLVDERSFSTTDNFARCLDDLHPECTVVGRPTGGGTGAPRKLVEATHSKAVVGACTMRVRGPRGKLTEGRGTVPDVAVTWTRADVVAGRDPDLAAALAALEAK